MSTEAAATLSLEINTENAHTQLENLETHVLKVGRELSSKGIKLKISGDTSDLEKKVKTQMAELAKESATITLLPSLNLAMVNAQLGTLTKSEHVVNAKVVLDMVSARGQLDAFMAKARNEKLTIPATLDAHGLEKSISGLTSSITNLKMQMQGALATIATNTATTGMDEKANLALASANNKAATSVQAHTNATKGFASAANEAHAFARGLSGSLGTLWMTYGSMVPLMAGAALAGGFMQAAKAGSEFAYQLTFVKALGGESAQSVAEIGTAALNLSKNSMYGPVELANGLRMLSQAGLTAAQSMEALPTVMNLATVGEMNMEQASLSLIGVMNAFGMSLQDLPHIGDMFSKAAALSQTSVAGMTEAMKAASVVHDQYGASVEDTATAIALLAKVNITGTAAGTSYRNMLKDLYTPSKEAAKTLEKLGVETKNANGSLREAQEILKDLKTKLQGFNQGSQTDILGKIFSERGGKEAIQMLGAVGTKWDELKNKISNSDGFMAGVTAELEMTTKGRFQQALNTMQTNLIKAFDQSEGSVRGLADSLRDLVDSPEFVQGLNGIVSSMAMLAKVAVDLAPALIRVGEAWLAFKTMGMVVSGVSLAINAFQGLSVMLPAVISATSLAGGGIAALGAEMVAASTATTALAGASGLGAVGGAIALLTNPITWLVAGIGAVALAAYNLKEGTPAGIVQVNNFNDVLDRQIAKLKEANAEMERKNRLQNTGSEIDRDAAQQNLETLRKERKALEARIAGRKNPANLSELDRNEAQNVADDVAIRKNKDAEIAQVQKLSELEKQQAQYDSSSLKNYIGQARQGLKDLKDDAANAKKSVNTAMVEAVIGQMEAGGLSSEGRRTAQRNLDRYMLEARQQMMGTGSNTYASDPKGGTAALKDANKAQITEMKGFIQEQEQIYAQFKQDTATKRAAGDITELQALKANWEVRNQTLAAEIEKQKEIIAAASKGKNSGNATEVAKNELAKLEAQQELAAEKYNAAVIDSKTKTSDEVLKLEQQLGGKLESEWDKQVTVLQGTYAKVMQETLLNWEQASANLQEALSAPEINVDNVAKYTEALRQAEVQLARVKKVGVDAMDAASMKDSGIAFQKSVAVVRNEMQELDSFIKNAEAEASSDGGWFSAVIGANKIQAEIDAQLPAIKAKMDAARVALNAAGGDTPENQKAWLNAQKDFDKYVNYVNPVWKSTVKKMDSIFHDGFTAMFSKGKTDWKAFGKSLADDFKTTVMDAIYQMIARPFVMNIVASVSGTMGVSGLAQAAGVEGAAGGVGGIGNVLSTGSSVYDAISGSAGSMYGNFATSGIGSALGLSTGLSTSLGVAGGAGSVMGGSAALAAVEATQAGAMGLTSLGASIGAALPVIGLAVAGISLLAGSLHKKTQDTGAVATSTNGGIGANVLVGMGTSADKFDAGMATGVSGINKSYFDTLNPLLAALGNKQVFSITSDQSAKKEGNGNQYAGFDIGVDGKNSTLQYGYGKVSDAEALAKATSSALGEGIARAISLSDLSAPIKKLFDGVVDQAVVGTMVTGLTKVGNASKELNDVWGISVSQAAEVAMLTGQTQEGIAKTVDAIGTFAASQRTVGATLESAFASLDPAFTALTNSALPDNLAAYDKAMKDVDTTVAGGIETFAALFAMREGFAQMQAAIDGLKTSASTAIDAFRTPEERLTLKQATLSDLSTKAGIAVPTSGAELVAMFDSIDFVKPTQAGMNLAAALPAIAAAFTEVQNAEKALASGATAAATAMEELRTSLLDHFATAQTLDQAYAAVSTGLGMSVDSLKNMSAEDLNKNLTGLITGADAAKLGIINGLLPALDMIGERAQEIASVTQGLKDNAASLNVELLAAQGNTSGSLAAARDLAIAGMNAEQAALWDTNTATQALIATLNSQAEKTAAIASERQGLQDQLDSLTMSSTQLLNKQRDALDESNRALFDNIEAVKKTQAIAAERKGLQNQYDELTMSSADLLSRQRDALDESNRALFDNIEAVKKAQAIASERKSLQDQLDELTMNNAQMLNKQRDALDESNRGLFDQIEAIKSANAAMADLASQIEAIAATRANVGSAKQGVMLQTKGFDAPSYWAAQQAILAAQFSSATTTTSKTDIAGKWQSAIASGLDAQIAALAVTKDARIKALQDEATLVNDNAEKAKETARNMASALSGIADYVKGMRTGALSTLSPEDKLKEAGSEYSRLLVAAQGGDATAAGKLTGASNTYLGLAKDYYASTSQYSSIFAQVEQSLQTLGAQASVYEQIANSAAATYDLTKATAEAESAYQASLLSYQEAAIASYDVLDRELLSYQGSVETRLDNQVIVLNTLGVKSDTIAERITDSQKAVSASVDRVNAATQQVSALLIQVTTLLAQANALAATTANATSSTASAMTLAGAA